VLCAEKLFPRPFCVACSNKDCWAGNASRFSRNNSDIEFATGTRLSPEHRSRPELYCSSLFPMLSISASAEPWLVVLAVIQPIYSYRFTPKKWPTPAVTAIAAAPQNATRNVAGSLGAAPACAPKAPNPARATSVEATTTVMT